MRPFLFALVIALVAGALGAYGFRRTRVARPVPVELATSAIAREVAVARALGFEATSPPQSRPLTGSTYGSSDARVDGFELQAGECVAVVAAAHGWGRLTSFRLSRGCPTTWMARDPNDLSVQQNVNGVVAHVQFCAWEPTPVNLCASGFNTGTHRDDAQSTIVFQVLRASEEAIGGAARLNRGYVTGPPPRREPSTVDTGSAADSIDESANDTAANETDDATNDAANVANDTPTTANDTTTANLGRAPNRAEVLRVMREVAGRVRVCRPDVPARATARVEFSTDGAVAWVSVDGVEGDTARCIANEVRAARLPPFESTGPFRVTFPFVFD